MQTIKLRIISANKSIKDVWLKQFKVLSVEQGATYFIIDSETDKTISDMVLKKQGDALLVEINQEVVVQIDQFFSEGQQAAFDVGVLNLIGEATLITASNAEPEENHIVWQPSDNHDLASGFDSWGLLGAGLLGLGAITAGAVVAATDDDKDSNDSVVNNTVKGTIVGVLSSTLMILK